MDMGNKINFNAITMILLVVAINVLFWRILSSRFEISIAAMFIGSIFTTAISIYGMACFMINHDEEE